MPGVWNSRKLSKPLAQQNSIHNRQTVAHLHLLHCRYVSMYPLPLWSADVRGAGTYLVTTPLTHFFLFNIPLVT